MNLTQMSKKGTQALMFKVCENQGLRIWEEFERTVNLLLSGTDV